MKKIGLLAGEGNLPLVFAENASKFGYDIYTIALLPTVNKKLEKASGHFRRIDITDFNEIFKYLKKEEIKTVTMLGKVTKELLFSKARTQIDARLQKLLTSLPDQKDDTLLVAFASELQKENIEVFDQTAFIKQLLPKKGVLTVRKPSASEEKDLQFAFNVAKELGRLDIGQTVVVKDMAVMALEAIEGTDACIKRGGKLAGTGAIVMKTAKPKQDVRFDVPTVGKKTIESMIEAKAKVLGIEAGKTLFVDQEDVIKLANEHGLSLVVM